MEIRKLLVANRGEIAARIFSTCDRLGAAREQVSENCVDPLVEVPVRDLAHEPDPEGDVGPEPLAGEEVAARVCPDPRQHEGRDDRGHDAEPDLCEAKDRLGVGDDDVRARDEPAAATERVAVHARNDRSGAAVDRLAHRVEPKRVGDVLLVAQVDGGALPLDVGAGAERLALSGQDDRPCVADVGERLGQLGDQGGVERVPTLGTGERDAEDTAISFDSERAHVRAA